MKKTLSMIISGLAISCCVGFALISKPEEVFIPDCTTAFPEPDWGVCNITWENSVIVAAACAVTDFDKNCNGVKLPGDPPPP